MSCALASSLVLDCRNSIGGLEIAYVTELANKSTLTTTAGAITAFTLSTGKKFWSYEQIKETSSFTEAMNPNTQNGTLFYTQELKLSFPKGETAKRNELRLLAQNRVMAIAKDRNGKYWLLGETNGLDLSAGTFGTGTAFGDKNGYDITLTGMEAEPAKEVDSTLIATLLAAAV